MRGGGPTLHGYVELTGEDRDGRSGDAPVERLVSSQDALDHTRDRERETGDCIENLVADCATPQPSHVLSEA
jgi:hypothetical protein